MNAVTKIFYGFNRTLFYFITCVLTCTLIVLFISFLNIKIDSLINPLRFFYAFGGLPIIISSLSLGINDAIQEPVVKHTFTINTFKTWGVQLFIIMIFALIHYALNRN